MNRDQALAHMHRRGLTLRDIASAYKSSKSEQRQHKVDDIALRFGMEPRVVSELVEAAKRKHLIRTPKRRRLAG